MSCNLWRSRLIELARGSLLDAERKRATVHVSGCRECRLFLEEQRVLTAAVAELAAETVTAPPAGLASLLLAEFDSAAIKRRRYLKPAAAAMGTLAAAMACFALLHAPPRTARLPPTVPFSEDAASPPVAVIPGPKPVPRPVRRARKPKSAEDAGPFVEVPYTVPLDPRERMTVMRIEMPVTALVAVGLAAAVPDPAASAQADVMVGEDGRIRAIRLVSLNSSAFDSDRRIN